MPTVFGLTINITTKQGAERWTNQNITASVSQRVGRLLAKQTRRKEELTMNVKIPITVLEEFLRRNQALLPTSWSGGTTVSDPSVEVLIQVSNKDSLRHIHSTVNSGPLPTRKGKRKKLDNIKVKNKGPSFIDSIVSS